MKPRFLSLLLGASLLFTGALVASETAASPAPAFAPHAIPGSQLRTLPRNAAAVDAATGQRLEVLRGRRNDRLIINTEPYDFRTVVIYEPLPRSDRTILPPMEPNP